MRSMKGSKKQKITAGKIVLMLFILAYIALIFGTMFGYMFDQILKPFTMIGFEWLYFGIMAVLVVLLCFIGSVFTTQQEIYGAKDNELLLAMPIKTKDILLSRIFVVLIINYVYEALVALPCFIVLFGQIPFDIIKLLFFIIVIITLSLIGIDFIMYLCWLMAMTEKN